MHRSKSESRLLHVPNAGMWICQNCRSRHVPADLDFQQIHYQILEWMFTKWVILQLFPACPWSSHALNLGCGVGRSRPRFVPRKITNLLHLHCMGKLHEERCLLSFERSDFEEKDQKQVRKAQSRVDISASDDWSKFCVIVAVCPAEAPPARQALPG
jgi:hypothetical protein